MLQRSPACTCGGGCPRCAPLQTKLSLSRPGDRYEQEADRIADRVMRMPHPAVRSVRRESDSIPTDRVEGGTDSGVASQAQLHTARCPGGNLPHSARDFFEPRFGQDFHDVRVHTCDNAAQMSASLDAKAFTFRNNVFFNREQYQPGTTSGDRLLAHELAHVVQQRGEKTESDAIRRKVFVTPSAAAGEVAGHLNFLCDTGFFYPSGRSIEGGCLHASAKTPKGCECVCEVVRDPRRIYNIYVDTATDRPRYLPLYGCNRLTVKVPYPSVGPHTIVGTHPLIHIPAVAGGAFKFGEFDPASQGSIAPIWRILAHELCGHGRKRLDSKQPKGNRPGHDDTIKVENDIAVNEHGARPRGLYDDKPRQGESFHVKMGDMLPPGACAPSRDAGRAVFKLKDGWYYEQPSPYPLSPHLNCILDHFITDSHVLTAEHRKQLPRIAMNLSSLQRMYTAGAIPVVGHTDKPGSNDHNMALGQRRADSVRRGLLYYCIPSALIAASSRGEEEPRIPTEREEPRNRRVETKFII